MKIAVIITSLRDKGPIIVAHDLIEGLMKKGHLCDVYYFKDGGDLEFRCKTRKISFFSNINFKSYDIIHCHGLLPDLFILFRKPLLCKTPVVTTFHSYIFRDHYYQYGKYLYNITSYLVLASTIRDNKIITLSKDAMAYYSKYINSSKLTYAYNTRICNTSLPLDSEIITKLTKFKGNSTLIGSNCVISELKNLSAIIKSLKHLPNFKFCIIGDGEWRTELEKIIKEYGVQEKVLFLGKQPEAHRFLPFYDIYAIPSKSEGFPLAMIEAAIYKKAILASNLPVFKEIFNESQISTFDLEDESTIIHAIKRLEPNLKIYGENAYKRYRECFSLESFVNRHLYIYQKVIDESNTIL